MSFKIGCWNVRGFNDPQKQNSVKSVLRKEDVKVFGLLETKIKRNKFEPVFGKLFEGWECFSNHQWSPLGRICIFFGTPIFVRLKMFHPLINLFCVRFSFWILTRLSLLASFMLITGILVGEGCGRSLELLLIILY